MIYNQHLSVLSLILLNFHFTPTFGTLQNESDCTENEELDTCGNRCESTCEDIYGFRPCPEICGPPACVCSGNYVRHPNGECVLPEKCPKKCPANEYLKLCGRICEDSCENYGKIKHCPRLQCTNFTQNCSCIEGYVRNQKGDCVKPDECPNCRKNETYTECGSSCPKTCNPRSDAEFVCPAVCLEGCFCSNGYVTSKSSNSCILPSDCPNSEKCFENETFLDCGSSCPDTCDNYKNPNRICTLQCVQGCFCKTGLVLNADRKCVSPDQCPPIQTCGEHEVYKDCGTACPDTCSNLGTKRKCVAKCVKGCFCEDGYVRSDSKGCVLPTQCPVNETCTKPYEQYNPCGSKYQRSCSNFFNYSRPECDCQEMCECVSGYVRDLNGFCVQPQECPNICGTNEKFDCGSACDTKCATLDEPCPIVNVKCNEKCYCVDGYARNCKGECVPINECT